MLDMEQGPGGGRVSVLLSYAIPAAVVTGVLLALIAVQSRAEASTASVAALLPVGYAFGAGMVASVNPCGFLMLPSYLAYHLGTEETGFYEAAAAQRALKALGLAGVATGGFVAIFAAAGVVIATGGQWLVNVFPYAGVAIGAAMSVLGLWLLIGRRTIGIVAAGRVGISPQRNLRNGFLFGIAYATGSLSCTLPIFLVVVGTALTGRDALHALSQFIGYALGMGTILVAVTIGAALFRGAVARLLRAVVPYVHRTSALFLLGAGVYLLYYWLYYAGAFF